MTIDISPDLYQRLERIVADTESTVGETLAKAIVLMEVAVKERKKSANGNVWIFPGSIDHDLRRYAQRVPAGSAVMDGVGSPDNTERPEQGGTEITGI